MGTSEERRELARERLLDDHPVRLSGGQPNIPASVADERQRAAFTLAAQRAAFALFAFNPHQRRGPDGRWIKMQTNELKRPRRPRKSRAAKAVEQPGFRSDELPPINLPEPLADYRAARTEYNESVYNVAEYMADQNMLRGRRDPTLGQYMYDVKATPESSAERDGATDALRGWLNAKYDANNGILDEPPERPEDRPTPILPPGNRTAGGPRPPLTAPYEQRRQALDASIRSGLVGQQPLGGGIMGDTRRVELADGTQAVYKRAKASMGGGKWSTKAQSDAEELGALVAAAVGVRAPAVQRADNDNLYMELVPGVPAATKGWRDPPPDVVNSDAGIRMGLLDILLNNSDRHSGNWMADDEENIYAIDHGLAFWNQGIEISSAQRSPFASAHFISPNGDFRNINPLGDGDADRLRQRLEVTRPRFEELGRSDWLDSVLKRLARLDDRRIKGGPPLYPAA